MSDQTWRGGVELDPPTLTVFVPGVARPQGSMQAIVSKSTGRAFMRQSPTLAEWRNVVVDRAAQAMEERGWKTVDDGPVYLWCEFRFLRPKSHSRRQREADGGWKYNGSDLDKLVRGVGDALTVAGVYEDDRQVSALSAVKFYTEEPGQQGVLIAVTRVAVPGV